MAVLPQQQHPVAVVDGDDADGADVPHQVAHDDLGAVAARHLHPVAADAEHAPLEDRGLLHDVPALGTVPDVVRAEAPGRAHETVTFPASPSPVRASA